MLEQNVSPGDFLGGFTGSQYGASRVDDDDGLRGLLQDQARKLPFLNHGLIVALLRQIANDDTDGLDTSGIQPV